MPLRPIKEIEELIQKNLLFALNLPLELRDSLSLALMYRQDDPLKGLLRSSFLQSLRNNKEKFGSKLLGNKGEEIQGRLGNWILDYERFAARKGVGAGLEQAAYLSEGGSSAKLSKPDKEVLIKVLQIYDLLRFTPVQPWLITQLQHKVAPVAVQKLRLTGEALKKREEEERQELKTRQTEILSQFKNQGIYSQGVLALAQSLAKELKQESQVLRDCLFEALTPKPGKNIEKENVLALLKILAEKGFLPSLLKDDARFTEMLSLFLKAQGRIYEHEGLKLNPVSPAFLSLILQNILKQKLLLSNKDSALIGAQIFNILKQVKGDFKYLKLAYFDMLSEIGRAHV